MTKLSVNLNKVALLRNQREEGHPSVVAAAIGALQAGAHGITVHPRPDGRHIRDSDVRALRRLLDEPRFRRAEFNVEGYPCPDFLRLVAEVGPDQVTLVPDPPQARTSDSGWDFRRHGRFLEDVVGALHARGSRVALFVDPDPEAPYGAAQAGADRVELYTGLYAAAFGRAGFDEVRRRHEATCRAARDAGVGLNAGHDLDRANLGEFLDMAPWCLEVSIGHALTADALILGWRPTIAAYRAIVDGVSVAA